MSNSDEESEGVLMPLSIPSSSSLSPSVLRSWRVRGATDIELELLNPLSLEEHGVGGAESSSVAPAGRAACGGSWRRRPFPSKIWRSWESCVP